MRNRSGTALLCQCCFHYATENLRNLCSYWKYGWAAAVAYMLCNRQFADIREELWHSLPISLRQCWRLFAEHHGFDCDETIPSHFDDFTQSLRRFETLTKSGAIGDFIMAMDEYAFPCVRCPAGCFAYVDECNAVIIKL